MPTILLKRINLDLIYPPFLDKILELVAACQSKGGHYYATYGHRTFAEQAKLYFQGRTTPGKRVTNAKAGLSCHNYGIAVDFVRDADLASVGLQPDWCEKGYRLLAEEGAHLGLQVGVPGLSDFGHVQLPLNNEAETLRVLKAIHDKDGLPAVWNHLDSLGPWT